MPDQAVAAISLGEHGSSSILEAVFHPVRTTAQQHIVGDVVNSGRENGKKSRKPRISESMILNVAWFMCKHYFTVLMWLNAI